MGFKAGDIVVSKYGIIRTIGIIISNYGELYFRPAGLRHYTMDILELASESDLREATIEEKVIFIRSEFVWGEIKNVHLIDDYQIIEFYDRDDGKRYQSYVNFKDTHCSYESLEEAIVGAISYKYDGCNSKADIYFWRMVGR